MLPATLLSCDLRGGTAIPRFLGDADRPWVRVLLDEWSRLAGHPVRELARRLGEPVTGAPEDKRRLLAHLLLGLARSRVASPVPPRAARTALFVAAGGAPGVPREEVLSRCADTLGVSSAALVASLFSDLPSERLVIPPRDLDPGELVLRANLSLAQGLLARAHAVRIALEGNARAVVRHASLRGLLCSVERDPRDDVMRLHLSGPFALFRRTLLYGRALGAILPVLAWTRRFRLEAACELRGRRVTLTLSTGDPIFPATEPRRFDSRIEERFATDFARAAPGWDLVREPEPVEAGGHLFFPDFALHPRRDPARRWLVEIVGFWTPDYLARKLDRARSARLANLLLCVDEKLNLGAEELPEGTAVLRFRRRVDARRVLEIVEGGRPGSER